MTIETPPEGIPTYSAPNSSLAIISLVAGILGLTLFPFLGSIVALITGYMAKKEIRESAGALSGGGMATAGLVMGWIAMGLTVLGLCCGCGFFVMAALLGAGSRHTLYLLPGLVALL